VRADVEQLTRLLVGIDSTNPSLVADGAGEAAVVTAITTWATQAGLRTEHVENTPGRPSVLVRGGRHDGGRTLLICGHTDTVSADGMRDPFVARGDGDRLYGRGAYDMKAGVAAALVACRAAADAGVRGEVCVACVADEEHASCGVQEVLGRVHAAAAVVTEPTELTVVVAHKGFAWVEVAVRGAAAHGSRPHLGVDAIVKTAPILTALGRLDTSLAATTHPLLGRGSVHASTITGGRELSSYPDRCLLAYERRTLPGEDRGVVERELDALLDTCRRADPTLDVSGRVLLTREPLETPPDEPIVLLTRDAAARLIGTAPAIAGASYWADSAFIAAAGIPTVLFGPGGGGAHAREEWVSIPDTVIVAETLAAVAAEFCA
jgi:acetylornithine deacetylase